MIRRAAHAIVCLLAVVPWAAMLLCAAPMLALGLLAHLIWPDADRGNCWTWVFPRYLLHGGYIVLRPADGQRLFGLVGVPHIMWMPKWGKDSTVRQTIPLQRRRGHVPWYTLYFRFRVSAYERPHDSRWSDLGPPEVR